MNHTLRRRLGWIALPLAAATVGGLVTYLTLQVMRVKRESEQLRDEYNVEPGQDFRQEEGRRLRRIRRQAAKWLRSHNVQDIEDNPLVFKLFVEMGNAPLNDEWRTIAFRRVQRWFNEMPTLEQACRKVIELELGSEPTQHADEEEPEYLNRRRQWHDRYMEFLEDLREQYEANPARFQREVLGAEHRGLRPTPGTELRISRQIVAAALRVRANEINEARYCLAEDAIAEAARSGPGLDRPATLGLLLAGHISWREYLWPNVGLPSPP